MAPDRNFFFGGGGGGGNQNLSKSFVFRHTGSHVEPSIWDLHLHLRVQ